MCSPVWPLVTGLSPSLANGLRAQTVFGIPGRNRFVRHSSDAIGPGQTRWSARQRLARLTFTSFLHPHPPSWPSVDSKTRHRLDYQHRGSATTLSLLSHPLHRTPFFSLLSFFSSLSSLYLDKHTSLAAIMRKPTIRPLYHLIPIPNTIYCSASAFPFMFNHCLSGIRRARAQARSLLVPLPPSFLRSLFTDSDHPSVCTMHCMYTRSPARHGENMFQIPYFNLLP
jgi:hypothetical protein